jgi:hypothetical protein
MCYSGRSVHLSESPLSAGSALVTALISMGVEVITPRHYRPSARHRSLHSRRLSVPAGGVRSGPAAITVSDHAPLGPLSMPGEIAVKVALHVSEIGYPFS